MKKRIVVTTGDILQGQRCEAGDCPVTRAVRRAVKPGVKVETTTGGIQLNGRDVKTPTEVGYFVDVFDNSSEYRAESLPAPITFVINIPASLAR